MDRRSWLLGALALSVSGVPRRATAEDTSRWTAVYIKDMHCADCANRIAMSLYTIPGVLKVKANLQRDLTFVVPMANKEPKPADIWLAIEKVGFHPVKLVGPSGVFTTRPKV